MINPKEVGARLSALRQERGMSQQAIAALMNVTHQAVSKWETGAALPDMQTMLALSKLYRLPMEELLMGETGRPEAAQAVTTQKAPREVEPIAQEAPAPEETVTEEAEAADRQPEAEPEDAPNPEDLPPMGFEEMVSLLPFLDTKTVDAMLERAVDSLRPEQMVKLAPFASAEGLSRAVERRPELLGEGGGVVRLYPFLSSDVIDGLLRQAVAEGREDKAATLAPFASEEGLDKAFKQAQAGGSVGMKRALAPFLQGGFLDTLLGGASVGDIVSRAVAGARSTVTAFRGFGAPGAEGQREAKDEDIRGRAARALRDRDEDWLDERAGELSAQELYDLCREAGKGADLELMLEHADKNALRELLQLAAKEEQWEMVSLAAAQLK